MAQAGGPHTLDRAEGPPNALSRGAIRGCRDENSDLLIQVCVHFVLDLYLDYSGAADARNDMDD